MHQTFSSTKSYYFLKKLKYIKRKKSQVTWLKVHITKMKPESSEERTNTNYNNGLDLEKNKFEPEPFICLIVCVFVCVRTCALCVC